MLWIETVSKVEATGQLADVYADIRQRRGSMANIMWAASTPTPRESAVTMPNRDAWCRGTGNMAIVTSAPRAWWNRSR